MENDERLKDCAPLVVVANDNGKNASPKITLMDEAVFRLARLLGRQIAREHFTAMQAANDNNTNPAPNFEN